MRWLLVTGAVAAALMRYRKPEAQAGLDVLAREIPRFDTPGRVNVTFVDPRHAHLAAPASRSRPTSKEPTSAVRSSTAPTCVVPASTGRR
jgi:hypothetical protein